MSETANTKTAHAGSMVAHDGTNLPSRLNELEAQAHMFAQSAAMNLLQLGRVLTEARPLIPYGQFDDWCKRHAKMSRRTADQYMQAYKEFGLDARIAELGTSKVIKLLPMSDEEREKLLAEQDVASMSARQLDAVIREQRQQLRAEAYEEARAQIEAAEAAAEAAERRAIEAENRPPEIPVELADQLRANRQTIQEQQAEINRLAEVGRDGVSERLRLIQENNELKRDLRERDEDMEAMQADYDRAQQELFNLQSAQARGDMERSKGDELTLDVFAAAVREFVGLCARMPYMGGAFSVMRPEDRNRYGELLRTVEGWCEQSRRAMESVSVEGGIIIG